MPYISCVSIENLQCFRESGELRLHKSRNVIVGRNNAGKTTLLRVLANDTALLQPRSSLESTSAVGSATVWVARPVQQEEMLVNDLLRVPLGGRGDMEHFARNVARAYDAKQDIEIAYTLTPSQGPRLAGRYRFADREFNEITEVDYNYLVRKGKVAGFGQGRTFKPWNPQATTTYLGSDVYYIHAERLLSGRSAISVADRLAPDGSNLPAVLNTLQKNPDKYAEFMRLVASVLPGFHWVSVEIAGSEFVLKYWLADKAHQRDDLSVPFTLCGTGVPQVLALLYVAFKERTPKTLLIDEPQTFLHPRAALALIRDLETFTQHQYVVSTHSPLIVSAMTGAHVGLLQVVDEETKLTSLAQGTIRDAEADLLRLGLRLPDVFGPDALLWVEGPTEEVCFPLILRHHAPDLSTIVSFRAVVATGDFLEKRRSKDVALLLDIYSRLSQLPSVFGRPTALLLDGEHKTPDLERLVKASSLRVEFLPTTMFEDYLLSLPAVESLIQELSQEHKLTAPANLAATIATVFASDDNAIDKLEEVFFTAFGPAITYDKIRHGLRLTSLVIEREPNRLLPLATVVDTLLQE